MKKTIKYLIFLVTLLAIGINSVSASTTTYERTDANLGVNKKWVIDSSNMDNVKATNKVDASEKIYDYADILSDSDESYLYTEISKYIDSTNMDMVILTTNLDYNSDELENYAADFYDYNDFGINFNLYSGIIVIVNMKDNYRFYNIFTFGDAQLYYPYDTCQNIITSMHDDMVNGNYYNAFSAYISQASLDYSSGIPSETKDYYVNDMGILTKKYSLPITLALTISSIITAIIMIILVSKNKMVKKEITAKGYLDKATVNYTNRKDQFVSSHTSSYVVSTNTGGGGGGSSVGSSGGGHGGGGGSSF